MALEALCGQTRRNLRSENPLNFGQDTRNLEEDEEFIAAFPNSIEPMKILAPPFVRPN